MINKWKRKRWRDLFIDGFKSYEKKINKNIVFCMVFQNVWVIQKYQFVEIYLDPENILHSTIRKVHNIALLEIENFQDDKFIGNCI
jgi:hypothetical protein